MTSQLPPIGIQPASVFPNLSAGDLVNEFCARLGINIEAAGLAPLREDLRVDYRAKNDMTLLPQVAFQPLGHFAPSAIGDRKFGGVSHDPADLAIVLRSVLCDADGRGPTRLPLIQLTTKFSPTAVSSVELAACKETDQVWSPTIPSTATPPHD